MDGAPTPIPLHAFISCTRKVCLLYILCLAPITVITYLNNINRLVFTKENVVFSARQKLGFAQFYYTNFMFRSAERSLSWFYSTGRK